MRRILCVLLLVSFPSLPACGTAHTHRSRSEPGDPPELLNLSENRALAIIGEALADAGVPAVRGWSVELAARTRLAVDYRLRDSSFGIAWISPQDRVELGTAVPEPAPGGQLRIVPGTGSDAGTQILVLEYSAYEYANEPEHVHRGLPGAHETEVRLRRDVHDFLEYVRGQGGV